MKVYQGQLERYTPTHFINELKEYRTPMMTLTETLESNVAEHAYAQ